ncbi:MAG TPA: carbohydrate kinase family protein [Candidatus Paceibacterota bacterium]|nr:carbohydrate kinase family protein [Candidatus Paceibacterota bacterium]
MQNEQIDFLAIGDIVTDAFIKIKDARVTCDIDEHNCKLSLRFGDKVPYESVEEVRAVGNSANAAVCAARLGVSSALIANVGKDTHGQNCLDELIKNNVSTKYVGIHEGIPTNYHYVLWYDVDRTILVKHANFPTSFPSDMTAPKMIYLSSLGEGTEDYHREISNFVSAHPETKLVFQPGTFQIKMGAEALKDIYRDTYAFFCNVEEAQRILKVETEEIKDLIKGLHDLGPKNVFITDGIKGAYASDGKESYFMPIYPHAPYERTGAGDAFASTVSVALLMGKSLEEALCWGPINSMSVVQYVGAQKGLLTKDALEKYLSEAPSDYKIKNI